MSPLVKQIVKAKGFDPQEQLILEIDRHDLLSRLGSNKTSRNQGTPWMAMAMALANLFLTQRALQKSDFTQSLKNNPRSNKVRRSTLQTAQNIMGGGQGQQRAIPKIAPTIPLQNATNALSNPSYSTLNQCQMDMFTYKEKKIKQLDLSAQTPQM